MKKMAPDLDESKLPAGLKLGEIGSYGGDALSPYESFPTNLWGYDWFGASFIQTSPGMMPRDAPVPADLDPSNRDKFGIDPMHIEIIRRKDQIHYLMQEYDRLVYIAT